MSVKKTTISEKRNGKPLPKGDPSLPQSAAQAREKENAAPETQTTTQAATAPAVAPEPKKEEKKESKPSISMTARRLVWLNQKATVEELTNHLVQAGFPDAVNRKATVSTLRTDCLSIIEIGRQLGMLKE